MPPYNDQENKILKLEMMLEEVFRLSKENNDLLHALKRAQFWARALKIFYWVFIGGIGLSAYYIFSSEIESFSSLLKNLPNMLQLISS